MFDKSKFEELLATAPKGTEHAIRFLANDVHTDGVKVFTDFVRKVHNKHHRFGITSETSMRTLGLLDSNLRVPDHTRRFIVQWLRAVRNNPKTLIDEFTSYRQWQLSYRR